jgi:hypothetical protein
MARAVSVTTRARIAGLAAFVAAGLVAVAIGGPAAGAPRRTAAAPSFGSIVHVSHGVNTQAAEPSIRVDRTGKQRIWIAAPTGIGINSRSLPANGGGDMFWYSDDAGATWTIAGGPGGASSPTVVGGGDSDVATGYASQVYGTGLTLANVTLAASCDNGKTFQMNPISNLDSIEDRQWIDAYADHPAPSGAPDFVLDYGNSGIGHVVFHQVLSPHCANPVAGPAIDVNRSGCEQDAAECYQWPGNVAIDERTGDAYVTYNTQGNPTGDKVIVTRVDGGASRTVTAADVHPFVAAANRPDTFDSFTVVAVDRAGNLYAAWSERHPAQHRTDIMLAVSTDHAAHWSKPIRVSRAPATSTFPWLVAGSAGRVDVVYYGTPATGPSPEKVAGSSLWRVYMAQSLNATSAAPTFREVAATPTLHRGSICTSGTGCASGTRDLLDFFQVDVMRSGMAVVAYTDDLHTPKDGSDPHQEWVTFVKQTGGPSLLT